MNRFSSFGRIFLIGILFPLTVWAYDAPLTRAPDQCVVGLRYIYTLSTGQTVPARQTVAIIPPGILGGERSWASDDRLMKTVFLVDLAAMIRDHLQYFHNEKPFVERAAAPIAGANAFDQLFTRLNATLSYQTATLKVRIANSLKERLGVFQTIQRENPQLAAEQKITEALKLGAELAANIESQSVNDLRDQLYRIPSQSYGSGQTKSMSFGGGGYHAIPRSPTLNVSTGGAQGYGGFKTSVRNGHIPGTSTFPIDGFLKEFDLSIPAPSQLNDTVFAYPAVAYNSLTNQLYVQIALGTNATMENVIRPPTQYSFALDISGSMAATDGTEKSRLEWAKEALMLALHQLKPNDLVSIVVFDDKVESLTEAPVFMTDQAKQNLIARIQKIQPRGGTDLQSAILAGYRQIRSEKMYLPPGYQHRLVLISDAEVTYGVKDPLKFLQTVSDHASADIGLTVIGVGEGLGSKLIDTIGNSKGGNYVYAQTGKDLYRFFNRFGLLTTPIASHFQAAVKLQNIQGQLIQSFGLSSDGSEQPDNFIFMPSLFHTEKEDGGGAIVLVYDLNQKPPQ